MKLYENGSICLLGNILIEQKHSSVEKEAYAIVEALRKWKHLLIEKHFNLVTDQRNVSFMLDLKHPSKIKNDKIQRWRLELAPYDFTTIYRPGNLYCAPDTFSRAPAASISLTSLKTLDELHKALCHPDITKLFHYVKIKNLPFSFDDVKNVVKACTDCSEVKVKFLKPKNSFNLIKATKLFERISFDLKGPLPTTSGNKYMLAIIDEYSRFPFVYACKNLKASTIIKNLPIYFACSVCQAMYILTRGPILCLTNLNCGCTAWVFLLAGLAGIILEAMDKSNVITVLHVFGKPSFWLFVRKKLSLTH